MTMTFKESSASTSLYQQQQQPESFDTQSNESSAMTLDTPTISGSTTTSIHDDCMAVDEMELTSAQSQENMLEFSKASFTYSEKTGRQLSILDLCNSSNGNSAVNEEETAALFAANGHSINEESEMYVSREEEVAKLLSEMREGSYSVPNSPAPPPSTPSLIAENVNDFYEPEGHRNFISRVSQLPVVNSTIKTIGEVYASGKSHSQFLKYSAETVESSVKSLIDNTKPMLSRFEPSLEQLDVFACKQLDRLEKTFGDSENSSQSVLNEAASRLHYDPTASSAPVQESKSFRPESSTGSGFGVISRWNEYLSHESMRSLQFCLEWLQYATAHIDNQIKLLKSGMTQWLATHQRASFSSLSSSSSNDQSSINTLDRLLSLAASVKREVVETVRKIVEIMGKYAGQALPIEARNAVRGFILSLPGRWQSITRGSASDGTNEADRVLNLAEESNRILKNTMSVFGNTSRAAEYWLGRSSATSNSPILNGH